MKVADFELYKSLLYDRSGLVITPDKSYLLDSRLTPIAKDWNYPTLDMMTLQLRAIPDPQLVKDIVEAMSTNETSFFRDSKPFTQFKDVILPLLIKTRGNRKTIRIWCAACSSGQEPYSLAMLLKDKESQLKGCKFEIIATDMSEEILEQARKGSYSQFEVQRGLPIQYLMKYFTQMGATWQLKDEILSMVKFSTFNLLDDMSRMGQFDTIFCRNVLIYFDEKTKNYVLSGMEKQLNRDGFLLLGETETVLGITDKFVPMPEKQGIFVKNPALAGPSTKNTSLLGSLTSGLFKRT